MNSSVLPRLWRRRTAIAPSTWFLGVGVAMVAGYYLLGSAEAQDYAYQVPEMLATGAIVVGIRRYRPVRWMPWLFLALGMAMTTAGDWTWLLLDRFFGLDPYPSMADAFYLGGVAALALGTLLLLRGRVPGGDRAGILDASIVAVGLGLLSWIFVMAPLVADESQSVTEIAVGLAYPLVDIALLAVLARLFFSPGRRSPALLMLMAAVVSFLAADLPYAVIALNDGYSVGSPLDAGWLMGAVLWGAAALHPSMRHVADAADQADARLTVWRLALLAAASLMAPAILVFEWVVGEPLDVPVVAGGSVVLFLLVIARLGSVVNDLHQTLDQRRVLERELERRALHDPLTGLANRTLFRDRLEHALERNVHEVAVLFLDLDDFKTVNDAHGHVAGDTVLRAVADAVRATIRPGDTVARLGGDEFAVLIDGGADAITAGLFADRVLKAIRQPIELAGRQRSITASGGISLSRDEGETPETLMRHADIAMYVSKSRGKGGVTVFEPTEHAAVMRGLELQTDLERGLAEEQFVLHYQPIVDLSSLEPVGAEALVRWSHPVRGVLGPNEFIPVAEASGAIVPLGQWILRGAVRQAVAWQRAQLMGPNSVMHVNVSAIQLADPAFVDNVGACLTECGLSPERLVLEVTESARLDHEPVARSLARLHDLGVQLAMDDFGTGYGAIVHLLRTPFDIVKVDQTIVAALTSDERAWPLLTGLLDLAHRVNARVVAEGVEDAQALARLREAGCEFGQGYWFARPKPPSELFAQPVARRSRVGHAPVGEPKALPHSA